MLKTTFKQFQQWKILYLDYYGVSTYNKSNNMPGLSRYTNFKLLNEPMKMKWIKNETVNITKCLMILQITFLFIDITTRIFDSAVIFTTNISQIIFTVFTVCSELNFGRANNYVHSAVGDEISSGITGMYASPEYSQP